jgi:serine/threonine protein phosphatase PrpC
MIPLRTEWQAVTDTGLVREHNEDRYCASAALGLWAVADGMGGLARGDWAATAVVEAVEGLQRIDDFEAMLAATAAAIRTANRRILGESQARGSQMGSTVVALIVRDRRFGLLWAGDSRAYLLRHRQLHQLSRDHSQVQELIDRGLLTPAAAATHPLRHVLTRAVGVAEPLELDMISDAIEPGDIFLLCSDGLHGVIDDAEIVAQLETIDSAEATRAMVAQCIERGAPDNVTVVTIVASEPTLLHFASVSSSAAAGAASGGSSGGSG